MTTIASMDCPADLSEMTQKRPVVRDAAHLAASQLDDLVVESPLVIDTDDERRETIATLMRTPGQDLELTSGWLVVESGVRHPSDIVSLRARHDLGTDRVLIALRNGVRPPRPRAFVTSAACGVCSADVLNLRPVRWTGTHRSQWRVEWDMLARLPEQMRTRQPAFSRTGGLHAAALADTVGNLMVVREDVGRHNATDKVIGHALRAGWLPATDQLLVVSGRVSFEIVQKAVAADVAGIVAVSAPSSLAVDLARDYGLLLVGMVRSGRMNIYAGAESIR